MYIGLDVEQKLSYLVENNLINIDSDLFCGKENKTKLVENLYKYGNLIRSII
jgi:hypothetical protein